MAAEREMGPHDGPDAHRIHGVERSARERHACGELDPGTGSGIAGHQRGRCDVFASGGAVWVFAGDDQFGFRRGADADAVRSRQNARGFHRANERAVDSAAQRTVAESA